MHVSNEVLHTLISLIGLWLQVTKSEFYACLSGSLKLLQGVNDFLNNVFSLRVVQALF